MSGRIPVRLHFDYLSPYSYLALCRAGRFAAEHGVDWRVRPVFYAAILGVTGLEGPAERPVRRRYALRDVVRAADRLGVPLAGPPAHPFNSLAALRATVLHQDDPRALDLAVALADACWGRGRPLTEIAVVAETVAAAGFDATGLAARIDAPDAKAILRENTEAALAAGVFGVPTFVWEGELFWGHDRMDDLADRLSGRIPSPEARAAALESRPRQSDRPGVAERFAPAADPPGGAA